MTQSQSIPSFLGGITQQPKVYRASNLVEDAVNFQFNPSDGAGKRYPTSDVAELDAAELRGYKMIALERDERDYRILIGDEDILVVEEDGTGVQVLDSTNSGGGYAPDFSYLAGAGYLDIRTQTIADAVFVLNRNVVVEGDAGIVSQSWVDAGEAGVFIRQANYGVHYSIKIKTDAMGAAETVEYTVPAAITLASIAHGSGDSTTVVVNAAQAAGTAPCQLGFIVNTAFDLSVQINGSPAPKEDWVVDPVTNQATYTGSGLVATDSVNFARDTRTLNWVIRTDLIARILREGLDAITGIDVEYLEDSSSFRVTTNDVLEVFEVQDSVGGTYAVGWTDSVEELSDLPLTFKHGAVVKILNSSSDTADDYYARFATEEWRRDGADPADFDTYTGFGAGTWIETAAPDLDTGSLDAGTMPHILRRTVDDGLGTVTGTPNEVYFDWAPFAEWRQRLAGDDETAPVPSFVGGRITAIFFHQGRLGFLSETNCVMSESSDVGNFWRTTVLSLPESDPIDISVAELGGNTLFNAVPFNRQLIVFSDVGQAAIVGDPVLTPQSVQAPAISDYDCFASVEPVFTGRSIFFGWPTEQYAGIREFIPGTQSEEFQDAEITVAVPRLLPSTLLKIAGSTTEQMLAVLAEESDTLYVYRYYRSGGELLLSAWSKWTFPGAEIVDVVFTKDKMDLALIRAGNTYLERIRLGSGQADAGSTFVTRLDRKRALGVGTYDVGTDTTAYFTPWDFAEGAPLAVVRSSATPGQSEAVVEQDEVAGTVTLAGDTTGLSLWIGETYPAYITLSRPVYRRRNQEGYTPTVGVIEVVRNLLVELSQSGYLEATVQYVDGDPAVDEFLPDILDTAELDESSVQDGELQIGIHADVEEFRVVLSNPTHLPCNLASGEWDVLVSAKHPKA